MITGLSGVLESVSSGAAYVTVSGITYEVLVSPVTEDTLIRSGAVGDTVSFKVYHYIEGAVAMGSMVPRIIGFLNENDRRFFMKITAIQGLGVKKALKAIVTPVSDISLAIEQGDEAALVALPEIGKKTAKKIIMELRGSMSVFITEQDRAKAIPVDIQELTEEFQREAVEILKQLQYTEQDAREIVRRTTNECPQVTTADALIQEVFKRTAR